MKANVKAKKQTHVLEKRYFSSNIHYLFESIQSRTHINDLPFL